MIAGNTRQLRQRVVMLAVGSIAAATVAASPLVFIVHPDWHAGDLELGLVQPSNGTFAIEDTILADMQPFQGKYILLSGDLIDGLWLTNTGEGRSREIRQRQAGLRARFAPDANDRDLVRRLCDVVYTGLNRRFRRYGLEPIAAIGDHELGDQNWTQGSPRAKAVPVFKEAFARAYTLDAQGRSRFDGWIGDVPQRPVGTAYADTCNAFIDGNVLFVTVDLYRFEGVDKTLHSQSGVVSVEMAPEVGRWLDALLTEAAGHDEIQFTIVQAHHPLILPVRKIQTSCILINDREASPFWELLRRHRVDVYFSGEVHALTPQVDPESQVAHIVCGSFLGNTAHNYLVCRASDGRLEILSREKVGDGSRTIYETTGRMVIEKSGLQKSIHAAGRLTPLNLREALFHYDFDQNDLNAGVTNRGQFGDRLYRGIPRDLRLAGGIVGKALVFGANGPGFFDTRGKAPLDYDLARTVAVWVKTTQTGAGTLCAMGQNDFCVVVDDGVPALRARGKTARAVPGTPLNDGYWHHLAVVYPGGPATLKGIRFYVDGRPTPSRLDDGDTGIRTNPGRPLRVGALQGSAGDPYRGLLDDLRIWASPVSAAEIAALYEDPLGK